MPRNITSLGLCFLFFIFASCSSAMHVRLASDLSAEVDVDINFGKTFLRVLANLSGLEAGEILDVHAINMELAAVDGVDSARLGTGNKENITGRLSLSSLGYFFLLEKEGQKNKLRLLLDRKTAPDFVAGLSEDVFDYLSVLMAPLVTGEEMDSEEYLDIISSVYGHTLAEELAKGIFKIEFAVPGKIIQSSVGKFQGRLLSWELPLLDLLVLDQALIIDLIWE